MLKALLFSLLAKLFEEVSATRPKPNFRHVPIKMNFLVKAMKSLPPGKGWWTSLEYRPSKRHFVQHLANRRDMVYLVDIYLGSSKQKVSVCLDTGSSDLWVPHDSYSPWLSLSSSTFEEPFDLGYIDGSFISGVYYTDRIQLDADDSMLPSFQFARANSGNMGVLGIANSNQLASRHPYSNYPWALKEAGIISKASYSLFLGPLHESGTIIFGGIDTEKYEGELVKYNVSEKLNGLAVILKSVRFNNKEFWVNMPAFLDSGTSLGLLHRDIINELDGIFDTSVFYEDGFEYRHTSCTQPEDKFIDFNFGQNVIRLSYADAIVQDGSGICLLGFAYHENLMILGDVFLRKAYVYYDLSENTISLAQVSDKNSSNIVSV